MIKNSKKVKQWQAEHRTLTAQALKLVAYYDNQNIRKTRKQLFKLKISALNHLMDEDNTFHNLYTKAKTSETETKILKSINEFKKTFSGTKKVLFDFFDYYTMQDQPLDSVFKEQLDAIIAAPVARIDFEEKNLYILMKS